MQQLRPRDREGEEEMGEADEEYLASYSMLCITAQSQLGL